MSPCISCLVSLVLTFIIPIKLTYCALRSGQDKQSQKLMAIYWGFYTLFLGIFWLLPFLAQAPFSFVITLFLVYLYHQEYKGGLLISSLINSKIAEITQVKEIIEKLKQNLAFLNLFEKKQDQTEQLKED